MNEPCRARQSWRAAWLALALVLAVGLPACNMSLTPYRNSGPAGERHTCPATKLNEVYNDTVDYDSGKSEQWRYVLVGQQGILTLVCHFDEIDAKTRVNLKDAVGNTLATQDHNGQPRQELTAKVREGKYYIEVMAIDSGSASPFTCEPKFDAVVWD